MQPRKFALFGGILMLAMGILALVPSLYEGYQTNLPPLNVTNSYGLFLGIFAMNIYNKVALMVFGVLGIMASAAPTTALPK